MDNPVSSGAAAPVSPPSRTVMPPRVCIARDGHDLAQGLETETEVLFAGLAPEFVGVAVVKIRVPNVESRDYLLDLHNTDWGDVATISIAATSR